MNCEQQYLAQLLQATQLLAADYSTQRSLLPDFVHLPDELALIYGDAILLLDQIIQTELITTHQAVLFREIDGLLDSMEQQKYLWTEDALLSQAEWNTVRHKARNLLDSLGELVQTPNLTFIEYLPGTVEVETPKTIEATFDGKLFYPTEPITLKANSRVRITVEPIP